MFYLFGHIEFTFSISEFYPKRKQKSVRETCKLPLGFLGKVLPGHVWFCFLRQGADAIDKLTVGERKLL